MEKKNIGDWICPMASHCGCVGNHTLAPICYDEWLAYLEKKNTKKTGSRMKNEQWQIVNPDGHFSTGGSSQVC